MIDWNNYTEELYNNVHKFKQESELKNEVYCNALLDNIESAMKKYKSQIAIAGFVNKSV